MPKNKLEWVIVFAVVMDILSWIGLGYFIIYWGGEAGSGVVQAGHYYLGKPSHREVSRGVFLTSLWNVRCLMASHFLTMILLFAQQKQSKANEKLRRAKPGPTP